MFDKEYKEAMAGVRFSPDFEERTVERLERALDFSAGSGARHTRHTRRARLLTGLSMGAAAALVAAVVLTGQMRSDRNGGESMPLATGVPADVNVIEAAPETVAKTLVVATSDEADAGSADAGSADGGTLHAAPRMPSATAAASLAGMEYLEDVEYEYGGYDASAVGFAARPAGMNTSEYSAITENGFVDTTVEPLSTFAADVDTASYANVRGILQAGGLPPVDAVRTEEFINYFDYDYPEPGAGEPFSVTTEIAPCPWNEDAQLLLVGLKTKDVDAESLPPSNLVFLVDVSGSMDEPNKLPLAQKAFRLLIDQLRPEDTVSIVTYAGSDRVVLDGARGDEKRRIADAIDSLFAYGSTDGASGIETAYRLAREHFIEGGNNRVILATDGDLNVGVTSEGELKRLIEEKRESGVFLSVMGFGQDNLKDNKLLALSDYGNGNYSYIDSVLEARKVLVQQMGANFFTVCKDVKLQIEFNPAKVMKYRLIGYEKRKLAASDFADDLKDGGEIGAGHSVTALYELVLSDGDTHAGTALKYQTAQLTGSDEYLTVSIRAKEPDGDVSRQYSYPVDARHVLTEMTGNMRFAAAVAEVCMVLRESGHKGSASYASASELLDGVPGLTQDPFKDEFAYLVRRLARSAGQ